MKPVKVIINPHARKRPDLRKFTRKLAHPGFSFALTCRAGHAFELARQAVAEGFPKVIAVGGDGTVNEAVNALAGSQAALGIIPAGGANDLATHLGIPADMDRALGIALHGRTKNIDLIKVNGSYYATVGGLGIAAKVAFRVNNLRRLSSRGQALYRLFGRLIYSACALREILGQPEFSSQCRLTIDGHRCTVRVWGLFVGNQPRLGNTFIVNPAADHGDAWLDICLIHNPGSKLRQLLTVLLATRGRHTRLPFVQTSRARIVKVESEDPLMFFGDGEILSLRPPHNIELAPRALKVMVPDVF